MLIVSIDYWTVEAYLKVDKVGEMAGEPNPSSTIFYKQRQNTARAVDHGVYVKLGTQNPAC
jgi:hypothetical protein